jgi:hypothetical protein
MSREAVVKSKEFNSQNIANLMWALATSGVATESELVHPLLGRVGTPEGLTVEHKHQLHQLFLFNSLCPDPLDLSSFSHLASACKSNVVANSAANVTASNLQRDVAKTLRRMGVLISEEEVLEDSGFSVDIRLVGERVVVEVDGPFHYVRAMDSGKLRVDGSTRLKHELMTRLGWRVLHVPYFEWDQLAEEGGSKTEYLTALLKPAA